MRLSKLTTIVIVTINGKVLKNVIKKLSSFYKIIIIENNNNKELKKKLFDSSKSIEVIVSKKNLGFAGGNNLALKKVKTLRDFDEYFTGPIHGFDGAEDYYSKCSSKQFLNICFTCSRSNLI